MWALSGKRLWPITQRHLSAHVLTARYWSLHSIPLAPPATTLFPQPMQSKKQLADCLLLITAEVHDELRRLERELGVEPDWSVDALMRVEAQEGHTTSIVTEFILRLLGLVRSTMKSTHLLKTLHHIMFSIGDGNQQKCMLSLFCQHPWSSF